jgi:hypothetical protein
MRFILLFTSCIITQLLFSQNIVEKSTIDKKITQFVISREKLPSLDCYAINLIKDKKFPLFIMVPGSKCIPLFVRKEAKNRILSTVMFYDTFIDTSFNANFIALERRNLKSFQEYSDDLLTKKCSDTYGSVDKKDRVIDVIAALKSFSKLDWVGDIYLMGHSEGADVVSGVAKALGDDSLNTLGVRAICFLASGGPTQFFDHIVEARLDTSQTAQEVFNELLWFTDSIPTGNYRGTPVQRYESYAIETTSLDELKGLDIPIFMAHGTLDKNAPILSDDLLAAELLRINKNRKLKYLILNGLDHGYLDTEGNSHSIFVFASIIKWIEKGFPRQVETRTYY